MASSGGIAAATKKAYKQDLPPKGGYMPFNYERIPARKMYTGEESAAPPVVSGTGPQFVRSLSLSAPMLFLGFAAYMTVSLTAHKRDCRMRQARLTEERSGQFAIEPMLLAERDRAFLKQLKLNRDYEAELMKDVEGWKVGTYFGLPVYNHVDNVFNYIPEIEFYAHCHPAARRKELTFRDWMII